MAKTAPPQEVVKTSRLLRVLLTDKEKLDLGQRLAREQASLSEAEDRKAEVAASMKATIEAHGAQINKMSNVLNNGYEYRDVACEIRMDFPSSVTVVRIDTGEVVEERPMTDAERQGELPV